MAAGLAEYIVLLIKILVFTTWALALFRLSPRNRDNLMLIVLLSISGLHELLSLTGILSEQGPGLYTSIALFLHQLLWILLIIPRENMRMLRISLLGMTVFAILDLFWIEGWTNINCYTFIVSSLFYIGCFSFLCLKWMREENVLAFGTNAFLLRCAPLLFMFGMTALLGFKSREISSTPVLGLPLYNLVNLCGNLLYYFILLIYLYRQKQHAN